MYEIRLSNIIAFSLIAVTSVTICMDTQKQSLYEKFTSDIVSMLYKNDVGGMRNEFMDIRSNNAPLFLQCYKQAVNIAKDMKIDQPVAESIFIEQTISCCANAFVDNQTRQLYSKLMKPKIELYLNEEKRQPSLPLSTFRTEIE
jgi:hypothetical protein